MIEISNTEIEAINEGRRALAAIVKRCNDVWIEGPEMPEHELFALGKLSEAADVAGNNIFNVINTAHNICGVPMTREQVHLR